MSLDLKGTVFQRRFGIYLCRYPMDTASYKDVAVWRIARRRKGGGAGHESCTIIVPRHRVVGSGGKLWDTAEG